MIAIDVSGSMAGDPFDRAKQAATEFVRSLGPNDEAAIIAFSDKVMPVVALTSDHQKLDAGIASLQAGGGTALYEAVQISAYVASASKAPRSAVMFLTDGENDTRSSTATSDGSIVVAMGSGVPIFTIGFGPTPDHALPADARDRHAGPISRGHRRERLQRLRGHRNAAPQPVRRDGARCRRRRR